MVNFLAIIDAPRRPDGESARRPAAPGIFDLEPTRARAAILATPPAAGEVKCDGRAARAINDSVDPCGGASRRAAPRIGLPASYVSPAALDSALSRLSASARRPGDDNKPGGSPSYLMTWLQLAGRRSARGGPAGDSPLGQQPRDPARGRAGDEPLTQTLNGRDEPAAAVQPCRDTRPTADCG